MGIWWQSRIVHSEFGLWLKQSLLRILHLILILQFLLHFLNLISSSLKKPFRISDHLIWRNFLIYTTLISPVFSFFKLLFIHLLIQSMHFAHLFDFIKINDEASFISVVLLNALSAKDSEMIWAIEMLHPLVMFFTEQTVNTRFVFEVNVPQYIITFHYFIQDIKIERQFINTFNLLNQFTTDRAPHSIIVMNLSQTLGAKSMSAMD